MQDGVKPAPKQTVEAQATLNFGISRRALFSLRCMKIYKSKLGLKFSISTTHLPEKDGVVFFRHDEWDWIKKQELSPEEFKVIWDLKKDDYQYNPVPKKEKDEASVMADRYCEEIKAMLKLGGAKTKEQIREEWEKENPPLPINI